MGFQSCFSYLYDLFDTHSLHKSYCQMKILMLLKQAKFLGNHLNGDFQLFFSISSYVNQLTEFTLLKCICTASQVGVYSCIICEIFPTFTLPKKFRGGGPYYTLSMYHDRKLKLFIALSQPRIINYQKTTFYGPLDRSICNCMAFL